MGGSRTPPIVPLHDWNKYVKGMDAPQPPKASESPVLTSFLSTSFTRSPPRIRGNTCRLVIIESDPEPDFRVLSEASVVD